MSDDNNSESDDDGGGTDTVGSGSPGQGSGNNSTSFFDNLNIGTLTSDAGGILKLFGGSSAATPAAPAAPKAATAASTATSAVTSAVGLLPTWAKYACGAVIALFIGVVLLSIFKRKR